MSRELEEVPLFPLNSVLLPYQILPINVFEPRYREMIASCMKDDRPFGVVLIREGQEVADAEVVPYMVGTLARIAAHSETPDGNLHLVAVGERRFRIRKLDYSQPYLVGYVEPIIELDWTEADDSDHLIERAKTAFRQHVASMFSGQEVNLKIEFTDDPVALSFVIAGCIHLSVLERQHLLEITDTAERIREIIPMLEGLNARTVTYATPSNMEEFVDQISRN